MTQAQSRIEVTTATTTSSLTWDVAEHNDDEVTMVTEGHVELVGERVVKVTSLLHQRQRGVHRQQFALET